MTEVPSPQLRISDQERESALNALGEHMSAGRIDIEEYGERSARITAAKTRGELAEMFADLPAPHPAYGGDVPAATPPAASVPHPAAQPPAGEVARPEQSTPVMQRVVAGLLPILWIAAIALTATTGAWGVILVPIVLSGIGASVWGKHFDHRDRHDRHRERLERHREHRLAHLEHRRELRDEYRRRRRLER
ncbi:DUF1707 SHOCT-like domain-containing protein [Amycolatopsis jiangsuensis]|uniref:DUF1707 domain-containing protein n=1 Tax=Amycolatopsis jiangsuensis TaxID=1181879 RepID=A0A840IWH1_9PSEU|nr:DUF1707 domain-containing protein [Amycolatopsis jiangsuensis]MBB4686200.1 hypothetical protein [Amycolatopsis jiangsuensis]